MSGLKFDTNKPQFHLLPRAYLVHLSGDKLAGDQMLDWWYEGNSALAKPVRITDTLPVLAFGAQKYGLYNFASGILYSRIFDAYIRHRIFYPDRLDEETGLPHDHHAMCNVLFAQHYELVGLDGGEFDDRPRSRILNELTADAQAIGLDKEPK